MENSTQHTNEVKFEEDGLHDCAVISYDCQICLCGLAQMQSSTKNLIIQVISTTCILWFSFSDLRDMNVGGKVFTLNLSAAEWKTDVNTLMRSAHC